MMRHSDDHLTDDELQLAIDRELPAQRQRAARAHVAQCAACRARGEHLEQAGEDLQQLYRSEIRIDAESVGRSRERLKSTMGYRSRRSGLISGVETGLVGAALVVLVLVGSLVYLESERHRPAPGDALPVASLTPGASRDVSVEELCSGGSSTGPAIPPAVRQQVLRDYGMEGVSSNEYELDYLITPELGGVPDRRNLWPERYALRVWNARVKDELEDLLPQLVCEGHLDLQTAQRDIAADWIAAYKKYFRTDAPHNIGDIKLISFTAAIGVR